MPALPATCTFPRCAMEKPRRSQQVDSGGGNWYMPDMTTTVFMNGWSQAVRLPKEFRVTGKRVSVRRLGDGLYLEPIKDAGWPKDYFRKIRIQDKAFTRPEQGKLPPVPAFGA